MLPAQNSFADRHLTPESSDIRYSGLLRPRPDRKFWVLSTVTDIITKKQREKLLNNGRNRPEDPRPVIKLFDPTGAATWLFAELDEDGDKPGGLRDLGFGFPELGYTSLSKISALRGRFDLSIERDLYFKAKPPLSTYAEAARNAVYIVEYNSELDATIESHRAKANA